MPKYYYAKPDLVDSISVLFPWELCLTHLMVHAHVQQNIPYSRKIWRGIKFGALADRPTDRQIKIRQYLIRVYTYIYGIDTWPHNNGCGRSRASARARAHCRSHLFFLTCMLGGVRFYYYLPCRCIDSSPKLACHRECHRWATRKSKTPTPVRTCGLSARARGRGYIEPSKSSAKFKSANIFVHTGWGQSAKFNARQIFRLYGISWPFFKVWDFIRRQV